MGPPGKQIAREKNSALGMGEYNADEGGKRKIENGNSQREDKSGEPV
jgi:hypothetical protein